MNFEILNPFIHLIFSTVGWRNKCSHADMGWTTNWGW